MKRLFLFLIMFTFNWSQAQSQILHGPLARGEVGNGDGSQLVGDWPDQDDNIKFPTFNAEEIKQFQKIIEGLKPDTDLKYEAMFSPKDQLAFDMAQAHMILIYRSLARTILSVKKTYIRAVVAVAHTQQSNPKQAGAVAEVYRRRMKLSVQSLIGELSNVVGQEMFRTLFAWDTFYSKDANGNISSIVRTHYYDPPESFYGTPDLSQCKDQKTPDESCGFTRADSDVPLLSAVRLCETEVCVFEIQKIAMEILEAAKKLDTKYTFKEGSVNAIQLFYNPHHSMARKALGRYLNDQLTNQDVNVAKAGLLGLTNLAYVTALAPVDFIKNLRMIKVSLDFDPGYFDRYSPYGRYRKLLIKNYNWWASLKL